MEGAPEQAAGQAGPADDERVRGRARDADQEKGAGEASEVATEAIEGLLEGRAKVDVVGLLGGRPVGPAAAAAVRSATLVAGGRDQLAGVADLLTPGTRTVVVGAGLGALDEIAAAPGRTCVLASGDPGCFGILRALTSRLGPPGVVVHPAPSSVALAFARLGLSWETAVIRSCHRGDAHRAAAEVARAPVAAVLCGPEAPPEAVGAALVGLGAAHRTVAVATRLGEPAEQVHVCADLAALAAGRFDPRSVVVLASPDPAAVTARARPGGRPVADFAHRASMITKPEVRSVVLGKLDLPDRGVLWDVGAGSGSVAIEAALAAPGLRVIAVERNPADVARVLANAAASGALVEVVEGQAPSALAGLPAPDRVFVGGGGMDVLDAAHAALRPGGRMVATFAAVDRAAQAHGRLGSLVQVEINRAEVLPDGGVRFAADNPVFVAWGDRPASPTAPAAVRVAVGIGCSSAATSDDVARVVAEALAAAEATGLLPISATAGTPAAEEVTSRSRSTDAPDPGHGFPSEEPGGRSVASVSSEEPGDRGRGAASSEELEGSFLVPPVTQRSQGPSGGAAPPRRGRQGVAGAGGQDEPDHRPTAAATTHVGEPGPDVVLATIDRRCGHPAVTGAAGGRPLVGFPASLLGLVDVPDPSQVVEAAVGTASVAEAAALLAAGPGGRLVMGKQRRPLATAAVAVGERALGGGRVQIVGLGPGDPRHRTPAASAAVRAADAVIGYGPYVDAAAPVLRPDQMVVRSAMGAEADRALSALALARAGWRVALVSSGDPGVFAMASVTLELAAAGPPVDVDVVPGLSASAAASASVGAPLAGPHAVLTLSDLLLPWPVIEAQLRAAAGAGLALALYNPRSAGRPDHLARARAVLLEVLEPTTPVAVVTAATTPEEQVERTTLGALDPTVAGMRSLVLVGTADTVAAGGHLLTRRHHPGPAAAP